MTVPVNLKDFPPLGSLHRTGLSDADLLRWQSAFDAGVELEAAGRRAEAMTNYQAALALDDHFAELHFRQGRCAFAVGQDDRARREFSLACDWDALPFRANSRLNAIVRQAAIRLQDPAVRLVDTERAFAESDPEERQIPGDRRFKDHVHPSFDGDYLLAKTLFPAVCEALGARLGPASTPLRPSSRATNARPGSRSRSWTKPVSPAKCSRRRPILPSPPNSNTLAAKPRLGKGCGRASAS